MNDDMVWTGQLRTLGPVLGGNLSSAIERLGTVNASSCAVHNIRHSER